MKKTILLILVVFFSINIHAQLQASTISQQNINIDSTSHFRTNIGNIPVLSMNGNVLNIFAAYKYVYSRYISTNDGNVGRVMWMDASGVLKVSPKDSIKVTPQMLQGAVTVDKGGTGLSSSGLSGQFIKSNGAGFIMGDEDDPVWGAEKVDYLTEYQSDMRYLQSYTETDGNPLNELQSISLGADDTLRLTLDGNVLMPYLRSSNFTWTNLPGKPSFSTVATSGDYDDLSDKPTIPTNTNQLTNGANFITASGAPIQTVFGRTGTVTAQSNDYTFSQIGSRPTTLSGYGITDAYPLSGNPSGFLISEVDGSLSNEGSLTVGVGTSTTSIINSNTSGSTGVTLTAGTGIGISEAGNVITITGTGTSPGTNNFTGYASGTTYNLTNTSAKVDFGTNDPTVTLTTAGTYIIFTNLKVEYSGLTTLATQTCNFKLRRTNNTAADLPNATTNFGVPIVTLLSLTAGDCDMAPIIYTTSNTNDVIELWGNRGANVSAGNIVVGEASVVAVRIY